MHPDLDCLHRTQGNIGEEFGGSGGSEIYNRLRGAGSKLLTIQVLEDFVETVFASPLHGVADESGCPTKEYTAQTLFGIDHFPRLRVGFVEVGVDLTAAFYL